MSDGTLPDHADHRDKNEYSVVMADCRDCRSIHPVGSRVSDPQSAAATGCPNCGSASYATVTRTYSVGDGE